MSKVQETHKLVKDRYAEVARNRSSCCGSKSGTCATPYVVPDHPVPEAELGLSCGNPLAFGRINKGDVVLDLGSGAGKDVFLAAQKVGEAGRAIGVDMTPEMLALARKNAVKFFATTGLSNVEFRQGEIESLPVEDATVDVVVSNCVINLSPDKPRVFREVHRVLKAGGRMIVSDIVLNRSLPEEARRDENFYVHCISGALLRDEYLGAVRAAGFSRVEVLADKTYTLPDEIADALRGSTGEDFRDAVASITVLAVK
jgi:arsenite methyltransferase